MDRAVFERMDELEAEHWWFVARRKLLSAAIDRLVPINADARVMEAGCGTGGNLEMLGQLGTLRAFEYDETARMIAKEKSGIAVAAGALPDGVPFAGESFDLICLFDVLEHIEDDTASLNALAGRLAPDGRILLSVPAYPWLWSRHDETHHHFRRYTSDSLREAAEAAGLVVAHRFHFNTFLLPVALAVRALKKVTGSETADDTLPSPWMNALLTRIFGAERHFVGRVAMPFGLSLCAVLKKPAE